MSDHADRGSLDTPAEAAIEFARPLGYASDIEQAERDALTGNGRPTSMPAEVVATYPAEREG